MLPPTLVAAVFPSPTARISKPSGTMPVTQSRLRAYHPRCMAEAIAALTIVMAGARPGITVLQTDSDDLACLLAKGYSSQCPLTNEVLGLIHAHAITAGTSIFPVHIRRERNSASDRLAAMESFPSVVAPLIAAELGIHPSCVISTFRPLSVASASETLSLVRARTFG